MKKFVLTLSLTILSVIALSTAYAANYTVKVTTQQQVNYRDKDGNTVYSETVTGNTMTFQVVADTPRQAEDNALNQCQGACSSGIEVIAAQNVPINGTLCTKYILTVPWTAEAVLN